MDRDERGEALRRCLALRRALTLALAQGCDHDVLVYRDRLDVELTALRGERVTP